MNTNLKVAKTGIIMGILMISLFAFAMPTTSAGPIKNRFANVYACYPKVTIDYDTEVANDPFLPVDMIKDIPINVSYSVTGYFAKDILPYYEESDNYIHLYVDETPDWCTAAISPNLLKFKATTTGLTEASLLNIKVNGDAEAFFVGKIKIRAEAEKFGAVASGIFYQDITFTPGYLPLLDIDVVKDTYKLIGPYDTANFGINIENMGNAKTKIICNLIDVPDGWSAHIDTSASTIIGSKTSSEDTNKTIQLVVKPPYGFGYHDERQEIKISIVPSYFNNESLKGNEYNLSFIVQSRGFSMPGFESTFVVSALIIIALIIKKRQRKKTFHNHDDEDEK